MKTFIRAIIVFVVLSLPASGFAMEYVEKAINKTNVEINELQAEIRELQDEIAQAEKDDKGKIKAKLSQKRAELDAAKSQLTATQMRLLEAYKQAELAQETVELLRTIPGIPKPPFYSGDGRILVIPAAEIKAKDLITITEDMSVMARIFDKKLGQASSLAFLRDVPFFSSSTRGTRSIYLDGYGALFLMKVDFPLAPSPKVQEKEIEEKVDLIWEQTKQEIHTPQDRRRTTRTTRRRPSEREKQYDAEEVEELKTKLIKALKHAANIRNLKPDESVILTVTAEASQAQRAISRVIATTGQILVEDEDTKTTKIYTTPSSEEMGFSSPTVMTIRAKKADVDAFSKGNLDFDQFRKKVRIFTY